MVKSQVHQAADISVMYNQRTRGKEQQKEIFVGQDGRERGCHFDGPPASQLISYF